MTYQENQTNIASGFKRSILAQRNGTGQSIGLLVARVALYRPLSCIIDMLKCGSVKITHMVKKCSENVTFRVDVNLAIA